MAGTSKVSFTQLHIKGGKAKLREKLNAEARRHGYSSIQAGINSGDLAFTAERKRAGFKPPGIHSQEMWSRRKALRMDAREPSKKRKK